MAITFRAAGTVASGTTSVTLAQPAGTATNDVLVALVADLATSGTSAAPTGWTRQGGTASSGGRLQVFTAVVGQGGLTGTSWTFTGLTSHSKGVIGGYIGVDSTVLDTTVSARSNASGTTGTTSIIPVSNGNMVVAGFGAPASAGPLSAAKVATNPSGTLADAASDSTGSFIAIQLSYGLQSTAGATGVSSNTEGGSAGANAAFLLALKPAITFTPDEDGWWGRVCGSFGTQIAVATTLAAALLTGSIGQTVANGHQDDPAGSLVKFVSPDEDYWQNPVAPVVASFFQRLPLGDPEEIPAGSLFGQPDEDYWINPVAPVSATLLWPQPFQFEQNEQATRCLDEDFWANPTAPVAASVYQRLPLGDPEELPAGSLYGVPVEEYWQNPVPPVPASQLVLSFVDPDYAPAFIDEDFWINPTIPVAAFVVPQPWFTQDEVFARLDEDYWPQFVITALGQNVSLAVVDSEFVPAPVATIVDEDYWPQPVSTVFGVNASYRVVDEDFVAPFVLEDYWATYPPLSASFTWPRQDQFEQNDFAALGFDEEPWFAPSPWALYQTPRIAEDSEFVGVVVENETWSALLFATPWGAIYLLDGDQFVNSTPLPPPSPPLQPQNPWQITQDQTGTRPAGYATQPGTPAALTGNGNGKPSGLTSDQSNTQGTITNKSDGEASSIE